MKGHGMATFSGILKKASDVLQNLGIGDVKFPGKDGDIVYSKNNVCVHPALRNGASETVHTPGYLTIRCQNDDVLGVTLILQWLANATLEKNPKSIHTISPRTGQNMDHGARIKLRHLDGPPKKPRRDSSSDSSSTAQDTEDKESYKNHIYHLP